MARTFFLLLIICLSGGLTNVLLLLGWTWRTFLHYKGMYYSFHEAFLAETLIINYAQSESVSKLIFWIYSFGMMMYHTNFLEEDLRTHESPLGTQAVKNIMVVFCLQRKYIFLAKNISSTETTNIPYNNWVIYWVYVIPIGNVCTCRLNKFVVWL